MAADSEGRTGHAAGNFGPLRFAALLLLELPIRNANGQRISSFLDPNPGKTRSYISWGGAGDVS